jgi:hypothetical protein
MEISAPTTNSKFLVVLSSTTIALAAAAGTTVLLAFTTNSTSGSSSSSHNLWDEIRRRILWSASQLYLQRRNEQESLLRQLMNRCIPNPDENSTITKDDNSLQCLLQRHPEDISILGITADPSYLLLSMKPPDSSYIAVDLKQQVGKMVAWLEEEDFTSTTFCFVTDASGGLGIDILHTALSTHSAKSDCYLLNQPLWIYTLAMYVQQHRNVNDRQQEELLVQLISFLFRLEERSVRKDIGPSQTLIILLPTQSTTAPLLPLLYKAFPSHRHVFVYNGACASVATAITKQKQLSCNNGKFIFRHF